MKLINKSTWLLLGIITIIEAASFLGYFFPTLKLILTLILFIGVFIFTLRDLETGLLILFAELIIGSKGHLFDLGPVSLRMVIFGGIILAYLIRLRKREECLKIIGYIKQLPAKKYLISLAAFILLGLAIGLARGNNISNIFSDFNSWPFFLLIFPILSIYFKANKETYQKLINVLIAAFLWLGVETALILYIFTHNLPIMADLYYWLRRTGVAEVTPTLGSWPRIFLQSQIYAAIALVAAPFVSSNKNIPIWVLNIIAWAICLLSMSRSFWLAAVITLIIALVCQLLFQGWKKLWPKILLIIGGVAGGILLILLVVLFPIPKPGTFSADSFINRASLNSNEAAVASRWSLLPVMQKEISQSPIIGYGFGKTITYKSSDPRVLQSNPSGEYTTYAFEWGYLSLWLKLGFFGLLAYLGLLAACIWKGLLRWRQGNKVAGIMSLGLLVLAIVHFFTPYLDHPLGIGYLLLAITFIGVQE